MAPKAPKPALLTSNSTSMPLPVVKAWISAGASGRVRSEGQNSARMPCLVDSMAARSARRSERRAVRTRCVPPAARRSARAKPIPALAPVTTAHFPNHLLRESTSTDASSGTMRYKTTIRGGAKAGKIGGIWRNLGGAVRRRKNALAQARTLMLEPVQEPASPHELSGKNAERQQDGEGARSGGYDHNDANGEQSEAEHNAKIPLGLLDCPY